MRTSTLISQNLIDLPLDTVYLQNVVARHRYFSLTNGMAFVIADCSKTGQLNSRYCLLEKLTFSSLPIVIANVLSWSALVTMA